MRNTLRVLALLGAVLVGGALAMCDFSPASGGGSASAQDGDDSRASPPALVGATCTRTSDCHSGQACVESTCQAVATSARGEILAAAAGVQFNAGDLDGATESYNAAVESFNAMDLDPPPGVLCRAATLILDGRVPENREAAARMAHRCLQLTLPGDPTRATVVTTLARLRHDGLNLAGFDADEAPASLFSARAARPSPDRVRAQITIDEVDSRTFRPVREALESDTVQAAVQDCFLQDWEIRHENEAAADITVRMTSTMRDHGSYDSYPVELAFEQSTMAQEGLEPCIAAALPALIETPRVSRVVSYETHFRVQASLAQ